MDGPSALNREQAESAIRVTIGIDWVIVGGESGRDARTMHPDWAKSLRAQCAVADVPFLFKQWGEWLPDNQNPAVSAPHDPSGAIRVGKKASGRLLDGRTHDKFPKP
jgi:protein gp37